VYYYYPDPKEINTILLRHMTIEDIIHIYGTTIVLKVE
jgi:hypothetical protein